MITEDIKILADHYGYDIEAHKLMSEMGELTQALADLDVESKTDGFLSMDAALFSYVADGNDSLDHVYEEIADVTICLSEVIHLLGCMDRVNEWREMKIKRQMERILNEQGEVQ